MHATLFSVQSFERSFLQHANTRHHQLQLLDTRLCADTAHLAQGAAAISVFSPDDVSGPVLEQLSSYGVRYVAVRAAGYDNVDLVAARQLGIRVANVPDYSPYAIAEHAVTLMLTLCRHLHQADQQLRANDFRLDQLIGFELHGKTVGILGVGRIGAVVARILHGFGCRLLGTDVQPNPELTERYGLEYVPLSQLCAQADIISVHTPLTPATHHLINERLLKSMKPGVMLINTGRGGVLDTAAALRALKSGHLGFLGLDVYEAEKGLFFTDHTRDLLLDDTFARLLTFKNVLITGHQAYLTREALTNIAEATVASLTAWGQGEAPAHELLPPPVKAGSSATPASAKA
ncbi:2-hydroxyacid dehydrogenase [Hymenobacter canadensis]|uniref:2-hydroxyacid dehydrogenase n=1 Tax=Hymenobacter canadensis TaxID=2999067 RepID=A0ABY7LWA4_9BACT|nr:2-hydroxyacid dehydrogenase [Hymenobacter canadensis]WBA43020.1 2-hydroxyacid dehydrogenase [Hymenobacter canadensis]